MPPEPVNVIVEVALAIGRQSQAAILYAELGAGNPFELELESSWARDMGQAVLLHGQESSKGLEFAMAATFCMPMR